MNTLSYLNIELKRIRKIIKESFIPSVIFSLCVCFVLIFLLNKSGFTESKRKYKIGIIGTGKSELLDVGLSLLKNLDQTKYIIDFRNFNSIEEASKAVEKDEIIAFLEIPEEFADSLYYFKNDSSIIVNSKIGLRGITDVVIEQISNLASSLILYTEAGLFTLMDYMDENGILYIEQNDYINKLFAKYVDKIIGRGKLTQIKELGISRGLSPFEYYFCSILLFFLLMSSFAGISFFDGQNNIFYSILKNHGLNEVKQIGYEFCSFLIHNLFSYLYFFIPIFLFFVLNPLEILDFSKENMNMGTTLIIYFISLFPVYVVFTFMEMFFFGLFDNYVVKILFSFIIFFSFCFASGYFYPQSFFPEVLRKIAELLPTEIAFSYSSGLLKNKELLVPIIKMILYSLLFYVGCVLVRSKNIKKGSLK